MPRTTLGLALLALAGCGVDAPLEPDADAPPGAARDCLVLKEGHPLFAGAPGEGVDWTHLAEQRGGADPRWGELLSDIERHLPAEHGSVYSDPDRITHAHETSHGIHAHIRNTLNDTGRRANGFYGLQDRAALVVEPAIRKSAVAAFVPGRLQGDRYGLYISGSPDWDDTPLYVFDEWVAYTNGGAVGVDLVEHGLWDDGWRDGVAGQLEFTVYALSLAMAVEQGDPGYFASNTQFLEVLAWNVRRAMEVHRAGAALADFAWERQDAFHELLRNGPDAALLRDFARRTFGVAWTNRFLLGSNIDNPGPDPPPAPAPEPDEPPAPEPAPAPEPDPEPDALPTPGPEPAPAPAPVAIPDSDGDGVADGVDLCADTPPGLRAHPVGAWTGCAQGEVRDQDMVRPPSPFPPGHDCP